jgi:hypothetical protein
MALCPAWAEALRAVILLGRIYAGLCDKKQVLAWLKKAHEERCDYVVHLPKEPAADPLRGEA